MDSNEGDDGDEEPGELAAGSWQRLLAIDDETLSLKPWKEVLAMKANKTSIAVALRAVIRQAWGECSCFVIILSI